MKNYYEILEIGSKASFKEIRNAYRRLSKKYHPDINPANSDISERFRDVQEAYNVLKDGIKREEFDEKLRRLGIRQSSLRLISYKLKNSFLYSRAESPELDDDGDFFKTVHQHHSRRNYYRGLAIVLISVLVMGAIFIVESRVDNLSYSQSTILYDTENTSIPAEQPTETIKKAQLRREPLQVRAQQPKVIKAEKENAKIGAGNMSAGQDPNVESVPVTIYSVNRIEEMAKKDPAPAVITQPENRPSVEKPAEKSTSVPELNKVFTEVERKPSFAGGATAFVNYLTTNLNYPQTARERGITGRVLVNFIVEKNGSLSNISVVQGIGGGCDEEAIRVMKNAPSWLPGEHKGEKVRVQCTIPITFRLD